MFPMLKANFGRVKYYVKYNKLYIVSLYRSAFIRFLHSSPNLNMLKGQMGIRTLQARNQRLRGIAGLCRGCQDWNPDSPSRVCPTPPCVLPLCQVQSDKCHCQFYLDLFPYRLRGTNILVVPLNSRFINCPCKNYTTSKFTSTRCFHPV